MAINFFDQSIPFWNTNTTYAQYEIVSYLGIIYSSKSSQAGNNPASDITNTYWALAGGGGVPNGLVGTTTVSAMKVVYATSTGTIQHADYSTELTTTAIGISTYGNTTGLTVAYQPSGLLKSFSTGMTPGLPLFLGASGAVITDPTTIPIGYYRVMIGYAINATDIMINLSEPVQVLANNVVKVGLGRVTQWPITTASLPSNMIPLDGRAISMTFYADLYALWGTTYGTGDGTSTFNVIDWTSLNVKDSTGTTVGYWVVQAFPDTVIVNPTAVASATSYIPNGDFENSTTGWATYYNGSATASPNGTITGTATNLNFARNTTTPLFGTGDFKLNQTGTSKGAGLTYDFTLDPGLFGQVMSLSFYYKTIDVSGTAYVDSDFSVFLYDITNSSFIPLSTSGISRSTSASKFYSSWFPSTSTRYRIFIHQTSTTTGVYSLEVDRVDVSPQTTPNAAAVGGWNTYTPSIVDSGGTSVLSASPNVNVGYWRRVGSNMEVRFAYYHQTTVGTLGAAGNYRIKIPSGYTIDSSFTSGSGNSAVAVGVASGDLGGGTLTNFTLGLEPSYNGVRAGNLTGTQFASGGNFQMNTAYLSINGSFTVPIAQWTTNINLATDFREYAWNSSATTANDTTSFSNGVGGVLLQSFAPTLLVAVTKYVQFTRPIQITDDLILEVDTSSGGWVDARNLGYGFQENDAGTTYYGFTLSQISTTQVSVNFYSKANKSTAWSTLTARKWRVRKVSNGNMAEVPPVVHAFAFGNTGQSIPNNTVTNVNYSTKVEDTHSALSLSGGVFTAPISGLYQVVHKVVWYAPSVTFTDVRHIVYVSGTAKDMNLTTFTASASGYQTTSITSLLRVLAGQTITATVYQISTAARTLQNDTSNQFTSIDVTRIGS